MNRRELLGCAAFGFLTARRTGADEPLPGARPVPRMQALPLPVDQVSIERDGKELTRYHFGSGLRRPYLYPVNGPAGRSLTRMGHPHAPVSHSHHNSVWASHHDVNGESYWGDTGTGRIVPQYIVELQDGDAAAAIVAVNHWMGKGGVVHLIERRGITATDLGDGEWLMHVDLQFQADRRPVTFGKTPFGIFAVRMAKSIGVNDGGGLIRNSEGMRNEQGPSGVFWKQAKWVDYSGPILPGVNEGITLFDHPANFNHPSYFHVRQDGWMGSSLTFAAPRTLEPGRFLRLRYGLYVHRGVPEPERIFRRWEPFARSEIRDLPNSRK